MKVSLSHSAEYDQFSVIVCIIHTCMNTIRCKSNSSRWDIKARNVTVVVRSKCSDVFICIKRCS